MTQHTPIYCIGSVLWDTIGRAPRRMTKGQDVPGRIRRIPGGVAMNIAMALRAQGLDVSLLSALGQDAEGKGLLEAAKERGIATDLVHLSPDHPTDQYMAVEAENGLIAAIADAHSLEKLWKEVIAPLGDGRLGTRKAPFQGMLVVEGNLPQAALDHALETDLLAACDLRLAPASPGKAVRMRSFLQAANATLYVNLIEANMILDQVFDQTKAAAAALVDAGLGRAVVTDGAKPSAMATAQGVLSGTPSKVLVQRVTGAGDVFMASHIAAELAGQIGQAGLDAALKGAAAYISSEVPL